MYIIDTLVCNLDRGKKVYKNYEDQRNLSVQELYILINPLSKDFKGTNPNNGSHPMDAESKFWPIWAWLNIGILRNKKVFRS